MNDTAKFVQGKLMRHIVVMSTTSAVGLMSIFFVDLLDMFFISLLGDPDLVAGVGIAGTLTFLVTSISIGTSIAAGALVSKSVGAKQVQKAREYAVNVLLIATLISIGSIAVVMLYLDQLIALMGAKGNVAASAREYLIVVVPSSVFLALGLGASAVLRAVGDARGSMMSTLTGAVVNAVLDPIFIFALDLGVTGAAIASVFARVMIFVYAMSRVHSKHRLFTRPNWLNFKQDTGPILNIALPAMLTNAATPLANAYVMASLAVFGNGYVAGYAVIGRLIPVCFAFIFSLSGSVGPILGQNFGAGSWVRVQRALSDAHLINIGFCVAMSILLLIGQNVIINLFKFNGQAADLIVLFCNFIAISFIFNGMLFVSNAALNNLGSPRISSALNVGKASIGTVPFVMVGAHFWQAGGVLIGQAIGSVLFGILGYAMVKVKVARMRQEHEATQLT
jgi:putative MATE family efflux protein